MIVQIISGSNSFVKRLCKISKLFEAKSTSFDENEHLFEENWPKRVFFGRFCEFFLHTICRRQKLCNIAKLYTHCITNKKSGLFQRGGVDLVSKCEQIGVS